MVGSIVPFWNEEINSKKEHLVNLWNQGPDEDLLRVSKGKELGYFQMGSTVILLFPSDIQIDKNFLYEAKPVKFGEELINLSERK
jgi:phosphatidylserine decarboxylase